MNLYDLAIAKKLAGGGGGNVNTYKIINGTVANPFGDLNVSGLITALSNKQATAYLVADASAIGAGTITTRLAAGVDYLDANGASVSANSSNCYEVVWDANGSLTMYNVATNGNITNAKQYASYVVTELTVVWHPINIS